MDEMTVDEFLDLVQQVRNGLQALERRVRRLESDSFDLDDELEDDD